MRLLITRAIPDAAATAERVRQAGHEPVTFPLFKPTFLPLDGRHDPAAILITSRNGVRAMAAWPKARAWRGKQVFAVGEGTAQAAAATGFMRIISAGGDARSLAVTIMKQVSPDIGPLFYAAAEDRGSHLEDTLSFAGYELDVVVGYRMVATETLDPALAEAIHNRNIDGVLLYSRRSARVFADLVAGAGLSDIVTSWRVFALSDEIAEVCRASGFSRIAVAAMPREDALIQSLGQVP